MLGPFYKQAPALRRASRMRRCEWAYFLRMAHRGNACAVGFCDPVERRACGGIDARPVRARFADHTAAGWRMVISVHAIGRVGWCAFAV